MTRRRAALWATLFLIIAVGSYGLLAVIEQSRVSINNPAQTLASGEQFDVDGETYTVARIEADIEDGELVRSGELSWVNDSAIHSKSLDNNSTLTLEGTEYRVSILSSITAILLLGLSCLPTAR